MPNQVTIDMLTFWTARSKRSPIFSHLAAENYWPRTLSVGKVFRPMDESLLISLGINIYARVFRLVPAAALTLKHCKDRHKHADREPSEALCFDLDSPSISVPLLQ
jgi:hypothetical protein